LIILLNLILVSPTISQTQEDFYKQMSEIYSNAGDAEKAKDLANDLFKLVEKTEILKNYSNYLILSQIFETPAPDSKMAERCKEKANEYMLGGGGNNANNEWNNEIYPSLSKSGNPENSMKAEKFLEKNEGLQNFNNYNMVAYSYEQNGNYEKAREMYETAISLVTDDKTEYHTYSFYTNFLSRSGEYMMAEEYINRMERLSEEAIEMLRLSYYNESLQSQSIYYLNIGDFQSYMKATVEMYDYYASNFLGENMCDPYEMSKHTISARAYEELGELEKADKLWAKRDESQYEWIGCYNTKFPNQDYKQYPLSLLPVFRIKTGNFATIKRSRKDLIRETEIYYDSFAEYSNMGILHLRAVHLGFLGAKNYHSEFEYVLKRIVDTRDFTESTLPFSNYSYFLMRDGLYKKANDHYDQLFKLNLKWINDLIFTFGEKAFVAYYNSKIKPGYDNFHSFVKVSQEKKLPYHGTLSGQAYDNLLLTKSIAFKGSQKKKKVFLRSNNKEIVELYNRWIAEKQRLIRLYQQQTEAQQDNKAPQAFNENEVNKLQEDVSRMENRLANEAKGFKENLTVEQPRWQDVRKKLKEGEAAIELVRFLWRDQVYYSDSIYYAAYIIKKDTKYPEVVYLPTLADGLDNKFYNQYKNTIRLKADNPDAYNKYWEPIKNNLEGIHKVYFSPDGIYHLINLPTLRNPESGKYLLEEMDIIQVTSTNNIREEIDLDETRNAALFGRPDYEMKKVIDQTQLLARATERSFVRNFRDGGISDLPGTEDEVRSIKKEMENSGIGTGVYLHEQATEDILYELHSPDILHIATHGFWAETDYEVTEGYQMFNAMVNSGLLLAGVINYYQSPEKPLTHDGILTAYEAQNLELENTDLVVLSACETGLGHYAAGEGVYGLQRAFRAAGAKSMIFSLWKVDDEATRDFMVTFYRSYLATKDKYGSFKTAQNTIKDKYTSPYFWGAFVLVGE